MEEARECMFFKSNEGKTIVFFKRKRNNSYQPIVKSLKKTKKIPLILRLSDTYNTLRILTEMHETKDDTYTYNFNLLSDIVAGASIISLKYMNRS